MAMRRMVVVLVALFLFGGVLPVSAESGDIGSSALPPQPAVGSFDFLFAFDPHTGMWHIRFAGEDDLTFYFGNPGDIPLFGDWDGDGFDTPAMYKAPGTFTSLIR